MRDHNLFACIVGTCRVWHRTIRYGIVHSGSEKWVFPAPILDEAKYRLDMIGLSDESM